MSRYVTQTSDKKKGTAFILCAVGFLGIGGLHDFYLGKIGSGIIKICTYNFFIFGTIYDLFKISLGTYCDNTGAPLRE